MSIDEAKEMIEKIAEEHNLLVPFVGSKEDFTDDTDWEISDEEWPAFKDYFLRRGMDEVYGTYYDAQRTIAEMNTDRFSSLKEVM